MKKTSFLLFRVMHKPHSERQIRSVPSFLFGLDEDDGKCGRWAIHLPHMCHADFPRSTVRKGLRARFRFRPAVSLGNRSRAEERQRDKRRREIVTSPLFCPQGFEGGCLRYRKLGGIIQIMCRVGKTLQTSRIWLRSQLGFSFRVRWVRLKLKCPDYGFEKSGNLVWSWQVRFWG